MIDRPSPPVPVRFLRVTGIASQKVTEVVRPGLPEERPATSQVCFLSYAYGDIPIGYEFEVVFPHSRPADGVITLCHVQGVTQQFSIPWTVIPSGWRTICLLDFPEGVPLLIDTLPRINEWPANPAYVCLASRETWEAVKRGEHEQYMFHGASTGDSGTH